MVQQDHLSKTMNTKTRLLQTVPRDFRLAALTLVLAGLPTISAVSSDSSVPTTRAATETALVAAKEGTIAARLTTPEELARLLGKPTQEKREHEGDEDVLVQEFPDITAVFARFRDPPGPYTLYKLEVSGRAVDIGRDRQLTLRTTDDLSKLNPFWGLAGVSLARLDLRQQSKLLNAMTFDSLTVWPAQEQLPEGFVPSRLLEEGKNPGLGVRALQRAGLDGRSVGIAIIDQPLLLDHEEYASRLVKYVPVDVEDVPAQMHGPSVASIAVGKNCGVAPGASLYYFAVPTWKWLRNEPWAEQLERVIEFNKTLKDTPKIRVVSISLGAFSERPNPACWRQALEKAEQANLLVITCDPQFLTIGTLKRDEAHPEPTPSDYTAGRYSYPGAALWVPAANRGLASFRGRTVYTYDRTGGMSWTVPYLAGVAALGWQVAPETHPKEMVQAWLRTATRTAVGPVLNPAAVVEELKKTK